MSFANDPTQTKCVFAFWQQGPGHGVKFWTSSCVTGSGFEHFIHAKETEKKRTFVPFEHFML